MSSTRLLIKWFLIKNVYDDDDDEEVCSNSEKFRTVKFSDTCMVRKFYRPRVLPDRNFKRHLPSYQVVVKLLP